MGASECSSLDHRRTTHPRRVNGRVPDIFYISTRARSHSSCEESCRATLLPMPALTSVRSFRPKFIRRQTCLCWHPAGYPARDMAQQSVLFLPTVSTQQDGSDYMILSRVLTQGFLEDSTKSCSIYSTTSTQKAHNPTYAQAIGYFLTVAAPANGFP